jgi:hypothetical protein
MTELTETQLFILELVEEDGTSFLTLADRGL